MEKNVIEYLTISFKRYFNNLSLKRITLVINIKKENVKKICTCNSLVNSLFNVKLIAKDIQD